MIQWMPGLHLLEILASNYQVQEKASCLKLGLKFVLSHRIKWLNGMDITLSQRVFIF